MRSKNRNILVALVAVFALGAVGVSSASAALPEFVHGEGEAFPVTFASQTVEGQQISISFGGLALTCGGVGIKGEITGAKTAGATLSLTRCSNQGVGPCETPKAKPGNITLTPSGALNYISKASKTVGVVLTLAEQKFECEEEQLAIKGTLVVPITPINTKTTAYQLTIHGTQLGKQEVTKYENEKGETITTKLSTSIGTGVWFETSLNIPPVMKLTMAKAITISA